MPEHRVLVVDDDEDIRDLVEIKLTRLGYAVDARCDGEFGLRAIRDLSPDLVLLDWSMPGRTGIEVLRAVRAGAVGPALSHVPIVMMTARAQPADLDLATASGATGYLIKPFRLGELGERVATLLGDTGTGSPLPAVTTFGPTRLVAGDLLAEPTPAG